MYPSVQGAQGENEVRERRVMSRSAERRLRGMKISSCRAGRTPDIGSGNGPSPGRALTGETRRFQPFKRGSRGPAYRRFGWLWSAGEKSKRTDVSDGRRHIASGKRTTNPSRLGIFT